MGGNLLQQPNSMAWMAADVWEADFDTDRHCLPPCAFKNQHLSTICGE